MARYILLELLLRLVVDAKGHTYLPIVYSYVIEVLGVVGEQGNLWY